jgi:hypothetical protein
MGILAEKGFQNKKNLEKIYIGGKKDEKELKGQKDINDY